VSVEVIVLGVANALRPTSFAAVYALLSTTRPRRLLIAFIVAGAGFSVATGILVVGVIHGAHLRHGRSTFDGIVELIAGVAALGFAAGLAQGRMPRQPRKQPADDPSRLVRSLRNPSTAVAAAAGIATHLPGLFYLVGLDAISAQDPGIVEGITAVLVFNAIWWAGPVGSLAFFLMRPDSARETLAAVNAWARRNNRAILVAVFAAAGVYLTVQGLVTLLG
jgi:Sap, sulfolipid-1-addressing protein